ncbi:uncharacterized protein M6G45_014177 isoform 2-T5 [Spheniscus humboldti]
MASSASAVKPLLCAGLAVPQILLLFFFFLTKCRLPCDARESPGYPQQLSGSVFRELLCPYAASPLRRRRMAVAPAEPQSSSALLDRLRARLQAELAGRLRRASSPLGRGGEARTSSLAVTDPLGGFKGPRMPSVRVCQEAWTRELERAFARRRAVPKRLLTRGSGVTCRC